MTAAHRLVACGGKTSVSLGDKLQIARNATRMSTRAVAARLSRRLRRSISHTTLANYEKNVYQPPMDVLSALAEEYERPLNWFLEFGPQLVGVRYRNLKSKVTGRDRHQYEALAQRWLDAYRRVELLVAQPLLATITDFRLAPDDSGEDGARNLRHALGLAFEDPLSSAVDLLERFGIRVMELPTSLSIDGIAATYGEESVVVLNPSVANDRCRMNALHELAHVLFGDCRADNTPSTLAEGRAFEFASHLLLPSQQLKAAFEGQSVVKLVRYKERFGISLAAMVYRAEQTGILKKRQARQLWIEFARRGWRRREPGRVRPDRSTRFEQLSESAVSSNGFGIGRLAQRLGVREDELRKRIDLAIEAEADSAEENFAGDKVVLQFPK